MVNLPGSPSSIPRLDGPARAHSATGQHGNSPHVEQDWLRRNCANPHGPLSKVRVPRPTLSGAISGARSRAKTTTTYEEGVTADDETGQQLEPLPGVPMRRLRRDHACGRNRKFPRRGGVPLRQVSNFAPPLAAILKGGLCPDRNNGRSPRMLATVTRVTNATTGPRTVTPYITTNQTSPPRRDRKRHPRSQVRRGPQPPTIRALSRQRHLAGRPDHGPQPGPLDHAHRLGRAVATTKTLRRRFFSLAGRITRKARRLTLHLPQDWAWQNQFNGALARLRALPLPS